MRNRNSRRKCYYAICDITPSPLTKNVRLTKREKIERKKTRNENTF